MPARRLRLRCSHVFTLIVVVFLVSGGVRAQTVTLTGRVSETVALSIAPDFNTAKIDASVVKSGNSVRLTLSSTDVDSSVIRIPLLVRSNCDFKISTVFESTTAELTQLSVFDSHPTGTLVSRNIHVTPQLSLDNSQPLLVLSGPRISTGGTLNSPNNALQITLLVSVQPEQLVPRWLAQLTFVATPE